MLGDGLVVVGVLFIYEHNGDSGCGVGNFSVCDSPIFETTYNGAWCADLGLLGDVCLKILTRVACKEVGNVTDVCDMLGESVVFWS